MTPTPNRYARHTLEDFIQVLRACAANTRNDQLQDLCLEAVRRLRPPDPPLRDVAQGDDLPD